MGVGDGGWGMGEGTGDGGGGMGGPLSRQGGLDVGRRKEEGGGGGWREKGWGEGGTHPKISGVVRVHVCWKTKDPAPRSLCWAGMPAGAREAGSRRLCSRGRLDIIRGEDEMSWVTRANSMRAGRRVHVRAGRDLFPSYQRTFRSSTVKY